MFHIKICGVRRASDVRSAGESGADAIGLNFFEPSVRYVDPTLPSTRELSQTAADRGLLPVGVFVNESPERIAQIVGTVGLSAIQLHGDEQPDVARQVHAATKLPVIRAIKLPTGEISVSTISEQAAAWIEAGCHLLLDADAGAAHGGSGKTLHWPSVRAWADANPASGLDVGRRIDTGECGRGDSDQRCSERRYRQRGRRAARSEVGEADRAVRRRSLLRWDVVFVTQMIGLER